MRRTIIIPLSVLVTASCLACGGASSDPSPAATATPIPTPTPPPATFLYLTGAGPGIQGYRLDESSGALDPISTQLPSTASTGDRVAAHPSGPYIYDTNSSAQRVAYQVDAHTGALSAVANSMSSTLQGGDLVADPRGEFFYYIEGCHHGDPSPCAQSLRVLRADKSTGALLGEAAGSPFTIGDDCGEPRVHPSGDFVYVQGSVVGALSRVRLWGFRVDRTAGTLVPAPGSPFARPVDTEPQTLAFHPTQPFVFLKDGSVSPNGLETYRIDPRSGALSLVAGRPVVAYRSAMTADPAGRYLYVTQATGILNPDLGVLVYAIDANTGALTPTQAGVGKTSGITPRGVLVHPSGRLLFVWEADSSVSEVIRLRAFAIDPRDAALTEVQGSPFALGGKPRVDDDVPGQLLFLNNSKWTLAMTKGFVNRFAVATDPPSVTALAPFTAANETFALCDTRPGAAK